MGLNKHDREEVRKQAESHGYRQSSTDKDKMIDNNGGSLKFSSSGGSVNLNGGHYNDKSSTGKSTKW